jgi:hypothetical protein
MLIVGDVHYLTISPEEFDRAWAQQQQCISPIQKASSISTNSPVSSVVIDPTSKTSLVSNHNVSGTPKVIVYEASFYATDDDFLMRTEIREFFRRNSVNPDDYQLFQLHRRSNHPYEMTILGPDGRPLFDRSQAAPDQHNHPRAGRLRTLCGLLDGGYHRNLVGFHTGYLSPLGFWVLMLALTGSTVSCALLLFPPYMQYVALGSLLGVFCILLLFFVDWTDGQRP